MARATGTGRGFRAADLGLNGQMQDRWALGKQTFCNYAAGRAIRPCLPYARTRVKTHDAFVGNHFWSKTPTPPRG